MLAKSLTTVRLCGIRAFSSGKFRTEYDTFGPLEVPADRYWGA